MFDLARFHQAQDGRPGLAEALAELRAGAKTGHWIWYVFPQLRGLGRSPMAVRYGLDGVAEAAAYLDDPVLAERLARAAAAVRSHVDDTPLAQLMGSRIDALKLVSSLTLFAPLARAATARAPEAPLAALADDAEAILMAAAAQGYPRCEFTTAALDRDARDRG